MIVDDKHTKLVNYLDGMARLLLLLVIIRLLNYWLSKANDENIHFARPTNN